MLGITINNFTQKSGDKLKIYLHLSVQDETRTHTAYRPLPPQSSASTNSATWTFHYVCSQQSLLLICGAKLQPFVESCKFLIIFFITLHRHY